jgi:hypothetical protein
MPRESLSTSQKALAINLDDSKYGTFAEIGAGQEVARWFFRVGGASGTVAKSISAYDMTFSDAIYGPAVRYVHRQRLQQMLDHEFKLLVERLDAKRGAGTRFFTFADTVATRNFKGSNECHGWLGIQFQRNPRAVPSQIAVHVRLWDKQAVAQSEALGIIGVNMVYLAFHPEDSMADNVAVLMDGLTSDRIEVDMVELSGPGFEGFDARLVNLQLVAQGMTNGVLFGPGRATLLPYEHLYKKAVLLASCPFRPVTIANLDMMERARALFVADAGLQPEDVTLLFEVTLHENAVAGSAPHSDFLQRADLINQLGHVVLVSNHLEYYRLSAYLRRYTSLPIGVALNAAQLDELFEESFYEPLPGGLLEGFGRLFRAGVRLYTYPKPGPAGELIGAENLDVPPNVRPLLDYLRVNRLVKTIDDAPPELARSSTAAVHERLLRRDPSWRALVPAGVAETIEARRLFGYQA